MLKTIIKNTRKLRRAPLMAITLLGFSLCANQVAMAQWAYETPDNQDSQTESSADTQALGKLKLININNSTIRISDEPGLHGKLLCESINNADAEALGDQQKALGIVWLKVRVINGNCPNIEGWVSINNTKMS